MNCNKQKVLALVFFGLLAVLLTYYLFKYYVNNTGANVDHNLENLETDVNSDNTVDITILGKKALSINKDRINDDIYKTGQLNNRWNLNEIDVILNSIKGVWQIDQYIGFVAPSIYYPDLFDNTDTLDKDIKKNLYEMYDKKIRNAENEIPEIHFSIKEYPTLYIKFLIAYIEEDIVKYDPATLVISSDNKFYILIDGAFYSLKG